MKNIFRVRTPQTFEAVDSRGADASASFLASPNEAPVVQSTPSMPPPPDLPSDLAQPELSVRPSEPLVIADEPASEPMPEPQSSAMPVEQPQPAVQAADVNHPPLDHNAMSAEQPQPAVQEQSAAAAATVDAGERASDWVADYMVPEMEGIMAEIQELKQFIQDMEQRKAELERKVSERVNLRDALLTGRGATLKSAVEQVFIEMGLTVHPSDQDGTHVILEHKGVDVIAAVADGNGPLTLADIRQLNHVVEDFIEAHGRQPKGLIVANPFCDVPPEARTANGHVPFPEELRLLAEQRYRFGLLTAPQLFVAYCKFKRGQLDVNEFISELFESVWVYGNHCDYDRFKTSQVAD